VHIKIDHLNSVRGDAVGFGIISSPPDDPPFTERNGMWELASQSRLLVVASHSRLSALDLMAVYITRLVLLVVVNAAVYTA
jgi:hypothetical protein